VARRFRKTTRPTLLVALALGGLALAPGLQAARLVDANLGVSLTGSPEIPVVGRPISYTATVVNNGPDQATGVSLSVVTSGSKASISATSASAAESQCTIARGSYSARCVLGTLDVGTSVQMTVTVTTAAPGTLTVTAKSRGRQYDSTAADNQAQAKTHVAEKLPPVPDPIFSSEFARAFSPHRVLSIRWRASDTGSGVASYDVRYRAAPVRGGFGSYQNWLTKTTSRNARFSGKYGTTYCFSFRATDYDGNTSGWTGDRCASVQLPAVGLRHTSAWIRSGLDGGLRTRSTGASLSLDGVVARRIVLSALVGPDYGQVNAWWNGRLLQTIDLRASGRTKRLFTVGDFGTLRRGRLVLAVVSTRKTVAVSALGVEKL
jgi:uncharacterized repeat protein (TIGR01451 family)